MATVHNTPYDLIVVGGGASGMMASGRAGALGKRVLLLEKNKKLGQKLSITGGGRCNITNAEFDVQALVPFYGKAQQFLYALFARFGVQDTFTFFESRGLPLVVEARKRAFPKTQKAQDVVRVLREYVIEGGVTVRTNAPVDSILSAGNSITGIVSGQETFTAKKYIFATGGTSHPETGATGDGFLWLSALGHTVKSPTPTIVPLRVADTWAKELSGVALSFMKITFFVNGKRVFAETGKILFTHFGISGPLILNCAGRVADLLHEGAVTAKIDAYPHTNSGMLARSMLAVFDRNKNKMLKNILTEIVPHGTAKGIATLLAQHLDLTTKAHSVSRTERLFIATLLKSLPLTITDLMGLDRAVIADGGVVLEELDMRTCASRKINNLSITGDLMHINRPSGGYSLQLCWSSGYVAGESATQ